MKKTLLRALSVLAVLSAFAASPVLAHIGPAARASRALNITDTAHLHEVRETATTTVVEEGKATGSLPGNVTVYFRVGPTVKATFTITTHAGTIIGSGSGLVHSTGEYASFGGSMSVTHGTGRYLHAHGHGGFYGTIQRRTYNATVQTTGTLSY